MMSLRRTAVGITVLLMFAEGAVAYTLIRTSAGSAPLHWPAGSLPIMMELNDQIGPSLPNVAPGSDPLGAIQRSLTKYPAVSAVQFQATTTSISSGGLDGASIVSFADTPANRQVFEMAGGNAVLGITLYFFSGATISEADLLFNPSVQFTTTLASDAALNAAQQADVEAVATHELGHVIGLHHTGVESATMWSLSSILARHLDADDIAGARALYPVGGNVGSIMGRVTVNGGPAFGAQVVAVSASGAIAASALTLPDGTYTIEQLAPGTYQAYVEPPDGPHSAVQNMPCIRLGNLNGAGIYSGATLSTDFATQFVDNVAVTANQATTVDFTLARGATTLNPVQVGPATVEDGSISASLGGIPLGVQAGTDQWVTVAGPDVDQVSASGIDVGPGIALDATSLHTLVFTCNTAPLPAIVFHITVDGAAAPGGRTIQLTTGNETAAFTGALRVSPSGPCVGDCNHTGSVTVEDLVTGANIVLGRFALDRCPAFNCNGNGRVTIDCLVAAVNNALNGCM